MHPIVQMIAGLAAQKMMIIGAEQVIGRASVELFTIEWAQVYAN